MSARGWKPNPITDLRAEFEPHELRRVVAYTVCRVTAFVALGLLGSTFLTG